MRNKININELSEELLLQIKLNRLSPDILTQINELPMNQLSDGVSDDQKKAFWINCYNAYFQILRKEYHLAKPDIYRDKLIHIAGEVFSLDDIEHGILRRNRIKWSLGYFSNPFAPRLLKRLMVSKLDYRIHFALNCGAKSCPPIAFYQPSLLHQQLEMATLSFLESETEVKADKKEIYISRLFKWFSADFGGRKGIRTILRNQLNLETAGLRLAFTKYDWDEALGNFADS